MHAPTFDSVVFYKDVFLYFMFEFPCIISLYYSYIKNQQDATLAVLL